MCTSAAADRVGLADRGRLVVGAAADVVVFDEAAILDRATFQEPKQFPIGIDWVIVNGQAVVEGDRQHDERRPGHVVGAAPAA
jgi:N-acyl-D-amino-acid deacylase